jgi:hypothetical protein
MEINGVPLHPLVIHAVVVFVPLAAVSAILFAVVPRWRWLFRWPTAALAVGAVVFTRLAVISGNDLKDDRGLGVLELVQEHQEWADRLEIAVWVFAVVALLAWWALPYAAPLVGSTERTSPVATLATAVTVVLPIVAAVVLVLAVITGDAGAKAVWKIE